MYKISSRGSRNRRLYFSVMKLNKRSYNSGMSKKILICKILVTIFCFVIVSGLILLLPSLDHDTTTQSSDEKRGELPVSTPKLTQIPVKATLKQPEEIRVLIKNQDHYYHDQITLMPTKEGTMNDKKLTPQERIIIDKNSDEFQEGVITVSSDSGILVSSVERAQGVPLYQGVLKLYQSDAGILLINELDLETYLQSVVPSEMPASYELEALKAQAVCARTYAYRNILDGALSEYHADVDDSISFQVYNNLEPQERSNRAIQETSGEVLICNGEPITAYFFSTSCGYTSTDEVWNSNEGQEYLKSIYMNEGEERSLETEEAFSSFISNNTEQNYEQNEKWYRWQVYLPIEYLNTRIQEMNESLGTFVSMEIKKRSKSGAVEELLITGSNQTLLLTNEYDIRELLAPGDNTIYTNDGEDTVLSGLLPSAYFISAADETQDHQVLGMQLNGGGYGHGVGLSQNGANNLAKSSKTYRDILNYFYQNIEITKLGA